MGTYHSLKNRLTNTGKITHIAILPVERLILFWLGFFHVFDMKNSLLRHFNHLQSWINQI